MWGIYRLPHRTARQFTGESRERVAAIEAPSEDEALSAFAAAEQVRDPHVAGWTITRDHRLVLTRADGHESVYFAEGA